MRSLCDMYLYTCIVKGRFYEGKKQESVVSKEDDIKTSDTLPLFYNFK